MAVVEMSSLLLDTSEQNHHVALTCGCSFVVWPHGLDSLQEFIIHIISVRPTIMYTMEVETVHFCFWTCWLS